MIVPNAGKDVGKAELMAGGNVGWCGHFEESDSSFKKLNMHLPYDAAVRLT